jgi:hypothetical protein
VPPTLTVQESGAPIQQVRRTQTVKGKVEPMIAVIVSDIPIRA